MVLSFTATLHRMYVILIACPVPDTGKRSGIQPACRRQAKRTGGE